MHFHNHRTTTLSISETERVLAHTSPPWAEENPDVQRLDFTAYTTDFAHFVLPRVLFDWDSRFYAYHPDAEQQLFDPRGNDADIALVGLAAQLAVPFVSNEGVRRDGTLDATKLVVAESDRRGVKLLRPREVFQGSLNEAAACRDFLARYEAAIPAHVASRAGDDKRESAEHNLRGLYGHFHEVLVGSE